MWASRDLSMSRHRWRDKDRYRESKRYTEKDTTREWDCPVYNPTINDLYVFVIIYIYNRRSLDAKKKKKKSIKTRKI